jgi:hypothetical protein
VNSKRLVLRRKQAIPPAFFSPTIPRIRLLSFFFSFLTDARMHVIVVVDTSYVFGIFVLFVHFETLHQLNM